MDAVGDFDIDLADGLATANDFDLDFDFDLEDDLVLPDGVVDIAARNAANFPTRGFLAEPRLRLLTVELPNVSLLSADFARDGM